MKVLLLVGVTVVAWVLAVPLAVAVDGSGHWLSGTVAAVLCLLPAVGTLTMLGYTEKKSPAVALGAVLVAPLLRLVVVCLVGGALFWGVPELRAVPIRFVGWVLAFYLITLVAETVLALPRKKATT